METGPIDYAVVKQRHPDELADAIKRLRSGTSKHAHVPEIALSYSYSWGVRMPIRQPTASLHVKIGMWWTWVGLRQVPPEVQAEFDKTYRTDSAKDIRVTHDGIECEHATKLYVEREVKRAIKLNETLNRRQADKEQAVVQAARAYVAAQLKFSKAFTKTTSFGRAQKALHEAREKLMAAVEAEKN